MTRDRYVIARGNLADEAFPTLDALAHRLLALVDEAGHGEATLCLRHGNAARPREPAGPCVALSVLDDEGGWRVHGFAYVFITPFSGDAHSRVEAALRQARPESFKPARMIPWPKKEQAA